MDKEEGTLIQNVVMPHLGLTMEEGSVVSWRKQLGERVERGEVLFTVETDKAEMEVEAADSGFLNSIRVKLGEKVPVGTVIATLAETETLTPAEAMSKADSLPVETAAHPTAAISTPTTSPGAVVATVEARSTTAFAASPRARRLAGELGIDITAVTPARGPRVVEEDVRHFAANRGKASAISASSGIPAPSRRAAATRNIVAERMTQSFQSAPHFYLGAEANATELVKLRGQLLEPCQKQVGVKLTFTDLFLRALALSLKDHPKVNAYWQGGAVQLRESVDVGFAAQTPDGLVVPVIHNADTLSLFDLARQRQTLTEKARAGTLSLPEMEGGSATLSNLGNSGIDWFEAILNPPQSVILATGPIAKRPAVVNDTLEVCPTVMMSLSVDHRVLDGIAGAEFLGRIKELIENPSVMIL
jgi:pyruvate dehydrogenase E2 component (dihydrolipoamide acetyltransferase)